jgi:hypothetical protein
MEHRIRTIFSNNVLLLDYADKTIFYLRMQNYERAFKNMDLLLSIFIPQVELLFSVADYFGNEEAGIDIGISLDVSRDLLNAQENKNYILLADLFELLLIPFIAGIQDFILYKENLQPDTSCSEENRKLLMESDPSLGKLVLSGQNTSELISSGYSVEYTSCGMITLAVIREGRKHYVHSNNNCFAEGFTLARSWYTAEKRKYIIYGMGLGYHALELARLDSEITIEIYESDINIIRLVCEFMKPSIFIYHHRIKLVYDPNFTLLAKRIEALGEDDEMVIHYPSLQLIQSNTIKEKLENYFIQYSNVKNQLPMLNRNFIKNIVNFNGTSGDLKEIFQGRSLFIIAAGPSLDKNFMQLKEINDRSKSVILATGTVFKKLMNAGIRPDYVLVTDPNAKVFKQIADFEDCDVPMIFLSTAYHGFASRYKGKKYLICQEGYPKAEKFARNTGLHLFQTGGSVSTTALDIGITLGCSRIIFLGLDLAYTDNYAHASDTSRRNAVQMQDMRQVEDIDGKMITTSRSLDMFRIWIENRIRDVEGIEFIDATEGGAKIHGMRIAKLEEVLKEI